MINSKLDLRFVLLFLLLYSNAYSQKTIEFEALNRRSFMRNDTLIEFYIASLLKQKQVKHSSQKEYYWYFKDSIFISQMGFDGRLLHGPYKSVYPNGMLWAKGNYKYGLKEAVWNTWSPFGKLQKMETWKNGLLNGVTIIYSTEGIEQKRIIYKLGQPVKK